MSLVWAFETSSLTPSEIPFPKALPNLPKTVLPAKDQALKYGSLWEPLVFKPPQQLTNMSLINDTQVNVWIKIQYFIFPHLKNKQPRIKLYISFLSLP